MKMLRYLFPFVLVSALHAENLVFPARGSEKRMAGELVSSDFIHRSGQFRSDDGALHDFTVLPSGIMHYRGTEADMREVPLGTKMDFLLLPDGQGLFTRLISTDDHQPVNEEQRQRFIDFTKARGIAGWIDKTEGNLVTLTFFSGDPEWFKKTWMKEFEAGKGGAKLCVANDELRTWNPPVDGEGFTSVELREVPSDGFGSSGVQVVGKVSNMLEGFRKGRVVRVFAAGWKTQDQFYGESLMGYGFGRMLDQELVENVAKEYPEQFPFRTEYSNEKLPWYQLKAGVMPPPFSEHVVYGELVKVDAATRSGQFRADRSGAIVNFTLIPDGTVRYLNADATLADLPSGTRCRFHLYQDAKGVFTQASFVCDEFSHLAANAVTWRIDTLKLADNKLLVARQIPEVKDYNGDMKRPPDIGRAVLHVTKDTRVWKGDSQIQLSELTVGNVLLVNLNGELPGKPSACTDIWVGEDTHKRVTEKQSKNKVAAKK